MTIEIGITGEKATVEVLIGMIATGMGGTGTIVSRAGAEAFLPITIGAGEEAVIMMNALAEVVVDQWMGILLCVFNALVS